MTSQGRSYPLARNEVNDSEFCGPAFSKDGKWLFRQHPVPWLYPCDHCAPGPVRPTTRPKTMLLRPPAAREASGGQGSLSGTWVVTFSIPILHPKVIANSYSCRRFNTAISSPLWESFRWTIAACAVYQGAGASRQTSPSAASIAL